MIFFGGGASGSGKTACMPDLARLLPEVALRDLGEIGVPPAPRLLSRLKASAVCAARGRRRAHRIV